MLSSTRAPLVAASLALVLGSAACVAHAPPTAPASLPGPAAQAPARPVVPPGHLARVEVDQFLVTRNLGWLARAVMTEEVMRADGKFAGWRLVGLPEDWRDIDLKPGDVVTRVNGLPIETPEQAFDAWKSVASTPELKISLMRDGAARQLVLPIDGVVSPETSRAIDRNPGPQRATATPDSRSRTIGGGSVEPGDEETY